MAAEVVKLEGQALELQQRSYVHIKAKIQEVEKQSTDNIKQELADEVSEKCR